MKKIVYILFFASVLAACEGPESETEWNRVNGLIARHGNFDPSVVPALLTGNMLSFAAYFELETEKLYYSDQVDMSIGGVLPEFLFLKTALVGSVGWIWPKGTMVGYFTGLITGAMIRRHRRSLQGTTIPRRGLWSGRSMAAIC